MTDFALEVKEVSSDLHQKADKNNDVSQLKWQYTSNEILHPSISDQNKPGKSVPPSEALKVKGCRNRAENASRVYSAQPAPTVEPDGLSAAEFSRITDAAAFIGKGEARAVFLTLAAPHLSPREFRDLLRYLESRIARISRDAGTKRLYRLSVLESRYALHAHIVTRVNRAARDALLKLSRDEKFSSHDRGGHVCLDVCKGYVPNLNGLADYLRKEMSKATEAGIGCQNWHYRNADNALPDGGDRVKCSKDLVADMRKAGIWQEYRQTYAKASMACKQNAQINKLKQKHGDKRRKRVHAFVTD